jgi:hypothetical protein
VAGCVSLGRVRSLHLIWGLVGLGPSFLLLTQNKPWATFGVLFGSSHRILLPDRYARPNLFGYIRAQLRLTIYHMVTLLTMFIEIKTYNTRFLRNGEVNLPLVQIRPFMAPVANEKPVLCAM